MNYWIMAANPDDYEIDTYFKEMRDMQEKYVYWELLPDFENKVEINDEVLIWRFKGLKKQSVSGVIGIGKVVEKSRYRLVKRPERMREELWKSGTKVKHPLDIYAGIIINEFRLPEESGMLSKEFLLDDPKICQLGYKFVIRARNKKIGNVMVFDRILKLWESKTSKSE